MAHESSRQLMNRAKHATPGGVHSYARTFDKPICFDRSAGSRIYDVDGNEYIDYLNAWGAVVLGHCHEDVNRAASAALQEQDLFGFGTTENEVSLAETIKSHVSSAERVLFGNTGSEVVASAITLARAITGRDTIIKFQGHYNGSYDAVALNHMSPKANLSTKDPFTEGLLSDTIEKTLVLPFNDIEVVEDTIESHSDEIAAIILEPIAHNMGCILPEPGYLAGLRRITREHGILLIFDEIITGFRHHLGGIQDVEGIIPDLTTFGKAIANGYPLSVLCGKAEYMEEFQTTKEGTVAYGGTYNAQAGSIAAARETIRILETSNFYSKAADHCERLSAALDDLIEDIGLTAHVARYGTTFVTYFADPPMSDYQDVLRNDEEKLLRYRWKMIDNGVMIVPKNARRNYFTASHTDEDVDYTIEAAKSALQTVK